MVVKLFVLGRAGSGKSTSVRYLTKVAQENGWHVESFDDHSILHDMFLREALHDDYRQFRPTECGGFEVVDFHVYNRVLETLEQKIAQFQPTHQQTLITIEFVRNSYQQAMHVFSENFLRDAAYLFIAADLHTCLDRVQKRAADPCTSDDFYVDEYVILSHFPNPSSFIMHKKVELIINQASKEKLREEVERFTQRFLRIVPQYVDNRVLQGKRKEVLVQGTR